MSTNVSQREFAKHIDRSHVWVNKLVKDGRLPSDDDGSIPLEAGLEAFAALQMDDAPSAPTAAAKKSSNKKSGDNGDNPTGAASVNAAYNKARLAEKTYQAKLRELEYKEASGQLLPVESVRADAEKTAAEVRGQLMSVPPRLAALCEGRTAREIERIITDGINDALDALQKSRFIGQSK